MDNRLDPKTLKPSLADARKWAEAVAASDLLPFSGAYSGTSTALTVTHSGTDGDGIAVGRSSGGTGDYGLLAENSCPAASLRSIQYCDPVDWYASALMADVNSSGNSSPVVDGWTNGVGPVYWGVTQGLRGIEIYTDASGAPEDSAAHVIHAVYDGGVRSGENVAVYGESVGSDVWGAGGEFVGSGIGVLGRAEPEPEGILYYFGVGGYSQNESDGLNVGVYGTADNGGTNLAGLFDGDVDVNGTFTKSAGTFRIDHPLDPANKYLSHSFVESPDMKNIYDGVAVLDGSGAAVVELPEWFEALNQDFRYQLTCIGAFAPVYVADEISGNRFTIAGGGPGMRVSWQVTGIRHDPYAEAYRTPVEEVKPAREVGKYRNPELYGAPESAGLRYEAQAAVGRAAGKARGRGEENRARSEARAEAAERR